MRRDALVTQLNGVSAVLVTPFSEATGTIDEGIVEDLARRCDVAGVHVLVPLGNVGEVHQLDFEERAAVLRATEAGRARAALVAGITGPPGERLRLAEKAFEFGYDAVMVHDPLDPLASDEGTRTLLLAFADRSPLPVILYPRTPILSNDSLAELAAHPQVIAIKYGRQDVLGAAALLAQKAVLDACVWICGLAEATFPAFSALGIRGFTSGIANVRPDLSLAVWDAARRDPNELWARVLPLLPFELLRQQNGGRYSVSVLKAALRFEGIPVGDVRPPYERLSVEGENRLTGILRSWPKPAEADLPQQPAAAEPSASAPA
jgi:4-hydroxy-tetrahydrodipicolinate synthase